MINGADLVGAGAAVGFDFVGDEIVDEFSCFVLGDMV